MKLFKLSLAAVVAAGALSSVSAAPLEEAIKDIDVSGFGRYRFQSTDRKPADTQKSRDTFHRFTLDVNFKATLDDNFFSVIGLRYDTRDIVGSHNKAYSGIANTHGGLSGVNGGWGGGHGDSFSVRQYYVGYTAIPYTTVLFGRQTAGTFFTDDIVASGLKVAVNPVEGLTLAALYYSNFENDGDLANIQFDP
ncbi:MAG: major outer membrane protein, partial [Campylobacter sp.]|nr:major outer membrane protein [Campylobacter sp.]